MTNEYLLKRLIDLGTAMRAHQKAYFETKSYEADKKRGHLIASKQAEKEFDTLLSNAKQILNHGTTSEKRP